VVAAFSLACLSIDDTSSRRSSPTDDHVPTPFDSAHRLPPRHVIATMTAPGVNHDARGHDRREPPGRQSWLTG
jgi:hypothetical protein